ncbi:hypothetical protein K1T71_000821 [Dendrolimus kikuchii]|uniref:Uncharacterized protein n=1 Tax=Dendrolimus kikuchii TaxID=765133 RepID=A0ACC1DKA4_9NEOP|nr:hypothetical protein K1T71_000821 [Dendrolimus kikuchii]
MSVKSNTVSFCCGCLNTEANLRNIDKKTANILNGLLGSQIINNSTKKYICITCYKLLVKSVRFKKQCLEARELFLSMVHVTEGSLNTLYKLNFKPNLTQTQVTILNIEGSPPCLKTDDNPFIPQVKQIKVEPKDEIVENESVLEEQFNSMQGNGFDLENYVVGDSNVAENAKVVIEVDATENVSFPTCMKLHEDFDIKEDCSDSPQEDSLDIGDVESGTHSFDDTSPNKILEREVQDISEETDIALFKWKSLQMDQQNTQQQSQRNMQSTQTRPYSNAERQRRYREKRKADKMYACTTFSQSSDVQPQHEQQQHDVQMNKRQPQSNAERQRKYRKLLRERQQQQMECINAITVLSNTPHISSIHQMQK